MAFLGLDIGSYAAKAVLLKQEGGKISLRGLGLCGLYLDAPLDWEKFSPGASEKMGASLKTLLKNSSLPPGPAATALPASEAFMEKILVPHTQSENPESYALKALAGALSRHPNELYKDCELLKNHPQEGLVETLFVAAPKRMVEGHLAALKAAQIKSAVLDVEALALANAYEALFPGRKDNVLLADIGARKSTLVLLEKGSLAKVVTEPFGGRSLSEALSREFRVSLAAGEAIKIGSELVPPPGDPAKTIVPLVGGWVEAVKRALDGYRKKSPSFSLDRVLLSGGQSLQEGLPAFFEKELGAPASLFNPLIGLDFDERRFDPAYLAYVGPQMLISFGLALR